MTALAMSKEERRIYVKNIEKHLRQYKSYKVAIKNLEKQLSFSTALKEIPDKQRGFRIQHPLPMEKIKFEIRELKLLTESIDEAIKDLSEVQKQYVECRYFNNWTISKTALEIGYSDKALFLIRNHIMDQLLIRLGGLSYME
ncbi:hypothetical protein SAMN05421736_106125 [Evansella caseinilytica]|uniref:Uncharacterized protein n=1 Tax=Evansella caseinilytica TaxID=1503961 RepID=A0A1H3QDK5_9BACI|nr:transcriptional regulator [Evansella caseinilytica]SDZ11353.1 hypothetical protein SAMN05421736_106125 [Evansella caseinilytica]